MMHRAHQLVSPVIARYGLQAGMEAAQVTGAWERVAREVLGASFPVPRAHCLKDGVLWLELPASVVAQEIQLSKVQLIEQLGSAVTDVRFRGAQPAPPSDTVGRRG